MLLYARVASFGAVVGAIIGAGIGAVAYAIAEHNIRVFLQSIGYFVGMNFNTR